MTVKTYPYVINGERHLSEKMQLTGKEILAAYSRPTRKTFLMQLVDGGKQEKIISENEVVNIAQPTHFITAPSP